MSAASKTLSRHPNGAVLVAEVFAIHKYGCPATRHKPGGACNCGGDELEAGFRGNCGGGSPWRCVETIALVGAASAKEGSDGE